ncbi:MAG: SCO family protein [Vulcanimicrobiaceae bacterium]
MVPAKAAAHARAAAALLLALVLGGCARAAPTSAIPGQTAPDFTLTDQDGHPFTLSAQRGMAVVLFFGYTHCPDVCPATLAKVERAVTRLGPNAARVRVVFVSVDPERDRPSVLRRFVRLFGNDVVGLSGSERSLAPVERAYHVWHQRLPSKSAAGHLVARSSELMSGKFCHAATPNISMVSRF